MSDTEILVIEETISVPDRDLSPAEMARIMRQVARVTNFLSSLIMKHAALSTNERTVGAGHPICQNIIACAVQADAAAAQLAGPPQIMSPQRRPQSIREN
jgi:hypothetical protein